MSTPIELRDFLCSRRSIRRFHPEALEEPVIRRILETATHAPSAHNRQPWRFAVLDTSAPKQRLAEYLADAFRRDLTADGLPSDEIAARIHRSVGRITGAPLVVILCMDVTEMDVYPDNKRATAERLMAIQSTAAAGLQLQLAAHAEGLASVWTCSPLFSPGTVTAALDLPPSWEPQAMFFIGHADGTLKPKSLKPLDEVAIRIS